MNHVAEIISVGTELLLGNIANTDAQTLSQGLSELGIDVYFHTVVGDNPERLKSAIALARERSDIIITTGGLGPTVDDLTKQTIAECFGKKLEFHEDIAEKIESYFQKIGREMTKNNLQQAYLPEGCQVLENSWGTAPGCAFELEGKHVIMLPGPPSECQAMFQNRAYPYLLKLSDSVICSRSVRIFGMGESAVEDLLSDMMKTMQNPTVAPYAKEGEVMVRITAKAETACLAGTMIDPVLARVREILGDVIYAVDVDSLEETILNLLSENKKTLAVAESCTGGMLSKRLTDIPGASAVFLGGAVTYSNDSKNAVLGVPPDMIEGCGAVSEQVARAMAAGTRRVFSSDLGLGITGIAGPDGGSDEKSVGTVYIALDSEGFTFCRKLNLGMSRARTRITACNYAMDLVRRFLTGLELE